MAKNKKRPIEYEDSYSTEKIKDFRKSLIFFTALPIVVVSFFGIFIFQQNSPSNPTVRVSAAIDPPEVRPFDPNHPIYQPVPANPKLLPNSAQIVSNIANNNNSFGFDTGGESPPIYVGKSSDPVWTISGGCGGRSVQVHAPSGIKAGSGSDYPLVILDQSNSSFTTSGTQPMEFRMWQATVNSSAKTIKANGLGIGSYRNDGAILSNVQFGGSNGPFVARALGHAEACGQNTGSGESYTVGMIRPVDVQRGRIDHAVRVAAGYLRGPASGGNTNNKYWHWPALRTEGGGNSGYLADNDSRVPMGARIFLDKSVDVNAVGNAAAARLSDPKNKAFAKMFIKALQEYGMVPLDGTGGGSNVYFESDQTANWSGLIGAKNSYGSYNDVSRAVAAVLPWQSLRVADSSVFNSYAHSNTSTSPPPAPAPSPSPSPAPAPAPAPAPNPSPGSSTQSPYGGSPRPIPGKIEAENFDNGGEGVSYHDTDAGNNGSQYRTTDVDIEKSASENSYNVGWGRPGEWLEYTVNSVSGKYDFEIRVASEYATGKLTLKYNGAQLGTVNVPNTGGWDTWQTIKISNVSIPAGNNKILRLEISGSSVNLNYIKSVVLAGSGGGSTTGTVNTPTPIPGVSVPVTVPDKPSPLVIVTGADGENTVGIPDSAIVNSDGQITADFDGDGLNDLAFDLDDDGMIDPRKEIVIRGSDETELTDLTPVLTQNSFEDPDTITIKAGPLPEAKISKPVAYTFLAFQGIAISGLALYLAITKLAIFAGLKGKLGL